MHPCALQAVPTGDVGALVGLVLSGAGGGGPVLAFPLRAHPGGVPAPHLAIGTSAVAVALNAASPAGHGSRIPAWCTPAPRRSGRC